MVRNLANASRIDVISTGITAASTSVTNLPSIDTRGFTGVMIIALLGALTATQTTSLKAQGSSDDGSTDAYADLAGSSTGNAADGDAGKCLVLDIYKPKERYVKPVLVRGTANAVVTSIIAILYNAAEEPVATTAAISKRKTVASPANGTA
jgi:hypothetical protein